MTRLAVRPSDPHTSHKAAPSSPGRETMQDLVRKILEANPQGLTDWELFEATGLPHHLRASVIKRRFDCGAVESGSTRPGPSGRECIVWVLR